MKRAIWYKHWVEFRGGFCVALIIATVLALVYPWLVRSHLNTLASTGEFWASVAFLGNSANAAADSARAALGTHLILSGIAAWGLGLFLWGNGIRPNSLTPNHPSVYYTLTLPASRKTLLATRFAVAVAGALAVCATLLLLHVAGLLLIGYEVPLGAMAAASAMTAVLLVTVIAVLGLAMIGSENVGGWLLAPAVIAAAALDGFSATTWLLASDAVPWTALGAMLLVIAGSLASTAWVAARRDF